MSATSIDPRAAEASIGTLFADSVVPTLTEYIRIPNKSPAFDPDWQQRGHMARALELIAAWCRRQPIPGMRIETFEPPGRTPLLYIEVPGTVEDTVLLYGHMDKQPEMTGWSDGLGPWQPVLRGDRLYGRGGADDGYATFAALAALRVLAEQRLPRARCVVLIEACEESGSVDLPYYIEDLGERIGRPSLIVCLDSGAGDYERLWCTTSLRGLVNATLGADVLREGVHSGASGVVPSTFRIVRMLLSRLEDEATGTIRPAWLYADIPAERIEQTREMARVVGENVFGHYSWLPGARPVTDDPVELLLNRTWRPQLAVTGAAGLPAIENAGNVLRAGTAVRLSLRLPPRVDSARARALLEELLTANPPYGASVRFESPEASDGWDAPPLAPWLAEALAASSQSFFGKPAVYMGEGGTIPFMAMLGARFPDTQFMITGVLGPESNAHGPNEFLHLPTARKIACCVADVIARHATRPATAAGSESVRRGMPAR